MHGQQDIKSDKCGRRPWTLSAWTDKNPEHRLALSGSLSCLPDMFRHAVLVTGAVTFVKHVSVTS